MVSICQKPRIDYMLKNPSLLSFFKFIDTYKGENDVTKRKNRAKRSRCSFA